MKLSDNQKRLANMVLRVKAHELSNEEIDLGLALLCEYECQFDMNTGKVDVLKDGQWVVWYPMTNWEQFGEVLEMNELVCATHANHDADGNPEGFWYSAHGYFGGIKCEGFNYRRVVGVTAIMLLEHNMKYRYE
jgi:hypothetical protein